jgi:hypothetical protein
LLYDHQSINAIVDHINTTIVAAGTAAQKQGGAGDDSDIEVT